VTTLGDDQFSRHGNAARDPRSLDYAALGASDGLGSIFASDVFRSAAVPNRAGARDE
jgi:hypothetical protein